jgi:repressor LexA
MSISTRSLTERQRAILKYIKRYIVKNGYPPAVRDICKGVGLSSSSSVHFHLNSLVKLGFIERDSSRTRAIRPITDQSLTSSVDVADMDDSPENEAVKRETQSNAPDFSDSTVLTVTEAVPKTESLSDEDDFAFLKSLGEDEEDTIVRENVLSQDSDDVVEENENVAEDLVLYPILNGNLSGANADFDIDFVPMPTMLVGHGEGFLITMHGDGMSEIGIKDSDLCIVKKTQEFEDGDVLAVIYGGEIIIKRVFRHFGNYRLESENPDYSELIVKEMEILGKLSGIIRIPLEKEGNNQEF